MARSNLSTSVLEALSPVFFAHGCVGPDVKEHALRFSRSDGLAIDMEPRGVHSVRVWVPSSLRLERWPDFATRYPVGKGRNSNLSPALNEGNEVYSLLVNRTNLAAARALVERILGHNARL
jgi:hypothetical protein